MQPTSSEKKRLEDDDDDDDFFIFIHALMVSRTKDTESGAAVCQRGGGNGSRALGDVSSQGRSKKTAA